jgi:hypothetical protein
MAEPNGSGRLDRIEASLENVGERLNDLTEKFHLRVDHREAEFKQLITWQVLMQDKMDKAEAARGRIVKTPGVSASASTNELNEITDKRVSDLLGALMRLVPRA